MVDRGADLPDDVLGHAAIRRAVEPIRVATGEHAQNRVIFKQLLQAGAIDVLQIDACRVGGVNEIIAILLLAAKFGVPSARTPGGVGLCEFVQHLAMFDYVAVARHRPDRWIEYVDHLHEHFVDPVRIVAGAYAAPTVPGMSAELRPETLADYRYPDGPVWAGSPAPAGTVGRDRQPRSLTTRPEDPSTSGRSPTGASRWTSTARSLITWAQITSLLPGGSR